MGASGLVILIAIVACAFSMTKQSTGGHKAWFTDDDGKTWFADDSSKLPPFDHDGNQAVMCTVCSCDHGKTKYVSYLLRVTPAGQDAIKDVLKKRAAGDKNAGLVTIPMEVKRPGSNEWVSTSSPAGQTIMTPYSPTGSLQDLQIIDPND